MPLITSDTDPKFHEPSTHPSGMRHCRVDNRRFAGEIVDGILLFRISRLNQCHAIDAPRRQQRSAHAGVTRNVEVQHTLTSLLNPGPAKARGSSFYSSHLQFHSVAHAWPTAFWQRRMWAPSSAEERRVCNAGVVSSSLTGSTTLCCRRSATRSEASSPGVRKDWHSGPSGSPTDNFFS